MKQINNKVYILILNVLKDLCIINDANNYIFIDILNVKTYFKQYFCPI